MAFEFECPYCRAITVVDERYRGHSGPCAECGRKITVPRATGIEHAAPVEPRRIAGVALLVLMGLVLLGAICGGALALVDRIVEYFRGVGM